VINAKAQTKPGRPCGRELRVRVDGQLTFNTTAQLLSAALAGFGLAYMPEGMVQSHIAKGRLTTGVAGGGTARCQLPSPCRIRCDPYPVELLQPHVAVNLFQAERARIFTGMQSLVPAGDPIKGVLEL